MRHVRLFLLALLFQATWFITSAVAAPQKPVAFVPGILGSKLGDVVWGTALSLSNFAKLKRSPSGADSIKACGLVEKVSLLGPFWAVPQYDSILSTFRLGYVEGTSAFVFSYDWRQSNFDSANALQDFIERPPQLRSGNLDVVAHSMRGIVSRHNEGTTCV